MATEAHTTEPVALLERGTSRELTAAEFNQPAEIASYLEKSENVKTPIDAEVESGIKGNAGAPEGGSFFESPTVVKVPVVKEIQQDEDLDAAEGTARKDNGVGEEIEEMEGKGITNNETVEVKNEYADAVEDSFVLTSVACKDDHKETEILDKTGEADNLALTHEEGKQSVIKEQVSLDASAGEGRAENVHTAIAAEDNMAEVAAAPEEMPSPKENLIQKDEPENEKIKSSEKVSNETETASSNELKKQEDCIDEAKEEKSNDTDTISDSGIPSEEIPPPTTSDEKGKNADDQHPTRSFEEELEKSSNFKHEELVDSGSGVSTKEETTQQLVSEATETGDEKLKHFYDSQENWDIKDSGKNMEEADLQVEISATSSNNTESKDEEKPLFNDNIAERTFEPENIQEAGTKLQVEVGEDVKEKIPEENVESNSQEFLDEDQTEDLQSDDKMTGQSGPENFEEHGTARTIDNAVKKTTQIDGITNLAEQECLQSENPTLASEFISNVEEETAKEDPRGDIKNKEIASRDDIIEVKDIIQTKAEAEDTGKEDSTVEDKIEVIVRETHEDPLQEEKGDDLENTELKEEIEDSKKEFTESIEERGYVEERESETLKDNEAPKSDPTPVKGSEETMLQKDVDESLAKIPTSEPESNEETSEIEKYDIDDSNSAPTTTKETILEEGKSEDKVEMQSSNLARGKEPIEMGMESEKLHKMDVDAESEKATNLDGSRDPETAVVENEVEEQIEHEIQTEAPTQGTGDQTIATASETPSAYMSDDIMKECSTMPSQDSEFVSSEASEIVDEDEEEKSKTSLPEVVEEEKAGTYNNELEAADTEIITQQECASKTMTGEESQEISCDTNQSDHEEKMTVSENESSEFAEQTSKEDHHETQEKEEAEEPSEQVKETQDAEEIVKAVILTEEVQDVEEADGKDKTVKLANEEREVIMEPCSELTEAESGVKEEESISPEQFKASDFNEQRKTVSADVPEASVMENETLIEKQTEVRQELDEAEGKSTGDSSTAAVQQSEEMKREITQGEDGPPDKIKEITTSENSLNQTPIGETKAHASNTTEDESSIDTTDVEASQQDDVVNRIAVDENTSNLASEHLAENTENATEDQIADSDADVGEEKKKASEVDVVHESADHEVEDANAEKSIEDVKEDSETVFTSQNIEALEKCEVSADQTVTEKRTKEELTPSPEVPSKEEEYENKTVQNEEGSTKEVGIVYESSAKSSASNSTNEACVSELGLDSPNEVHEENKGTLDEKVEVEETSEAAIEHVVASDQTFHEDKGQEHAEVCIQTNEPRELEASQPSLAFNEEKKDEIQDETDEKKEAQGVISEASVQTLPVQRTDGQNQTSSELLLEEQEGISAPKDVIAEKEISSDQTLLTEKMEEQKEALSKQEHLASATIESEERSKEVEVSDDQTKTTKEVSLQSEVPEEHEIQMDSPEEVRPDEDSSEKREYIKKAAGLSSRPDSQAFEAPKEDEVASDTTLVTEERSEGESQMPSDEMIDETPASSELIKQLMQEGENIEKSACFSTEGTKEVEAIEMELEKVNVNEVSNKDIGTPEEVLNLQTHEKPSNDVESEEITGSEVQSYEKTRESEEREESLVAAIPEFVQTNQPKETVDATDVAGNEITKEEVADKNEEWVSSPVTLNEEPTKESSQLYELTAEARLGDDMMEKEIQNKKESDAEISDVKESVGEVEISTDENVPIAKSGEPSEIPSAQEKSEEYIEATTKEVEMVEDGSSRTESVSFPKEGDTVLETCHSKSPLDAEEQKEAPKQVHEEEDIAPAETGEEIKKDVECDSVPKSDFQGFESTKDEIVSGDTLATGKTLEEKSMTPSADLVSQITTLSEETENQEKTEKTQGDTTLQTKEQESQELALEKESKEEREDTDEAFKLESHENQTVVERELLTENEEVVGLSKETSHLKTNTSDDTSTPESEIYSSEVEDTQREEAITNDTTEPMFKEVINERIMENKDDTNDTEEKSGENLRDHRTAEEPQTEEEVDTDMSNAQEAVEDNTITTDKSFLVAKLDEIQSDALLSEEQKQGTSGTTDLIKEAKGVEGGQEPIAMEEVPLQKEEPIELGVSQVETQLDKSILEAPRELHEEESTKEQMEVIRDVPVIMEEASWQKEEPRGLEISESKRPLDADVQMDNQQEIPEEEDSAPIEPKEEIKEQGVSTEILDTKEAVEEDKITSEDSVALFSEEQKHVTSEPTECIKEVIKGAEGTEVEPNSTEEEPLQKEEPRELEVFQEETQLNKYVQETLSDVHEEAATTKEVEVVGDALNIMEEASVQKEEPREPEISESNRLLDADVKMDSQNEVQAEEKGSFITTEDEVESKSMSYSDSQVLEAPEEDKSTSAETLATEEKSEEQSQIPFAASETTIPSEKEEQEKAVESLEDDNLKNSAIPNDLEVQGSVLDKDQSLEEKKTRDEAVKLASEENKTNLKAEKSVHESESITEIVGLPEGTTNIKNEISEETLESESEIHGNEVITEPGKTEIKEEEAIANKIVDNEVINNEVAEDKDAQTVCEVTTTELHQEPQPNLDESLKEDFFTEKSDAKEEIVEEKITSDKDLLMAKSEEKIQIPPAALHLEAQTHGASATIESREVAMEDIEGITNEPKTAEEVPEAHSHLEGSKLETPVRNHELESPRELQQEESEVTGETKEETKGTSDTPLKFDSNETEDKTDSNSKEISAVLASQTTTVLEKFEDPKREVETPGNESPQISKEESKETEEGEASKLENTVEPAKVQQINLTDEQVTESKQGTIIESQQKSSEATQNEKVETTQEERKTADATSGEKKTSEAEERGTSEGKLSLQDMLEKSPRQWPQAAEETEDAENAKSGEEEEDAGEEQKKGDSSGSDAPVVVEALTEMEIKTPHKKSLLSGVGSKVKHSISKVKKAITGSSGKSSSQAKQQHSPK